MADNAPATNQSGTNSGQQPQGWWDRTKNFFNVHGSGVVDDVKEGAKGTLEAAEIGAMMPGAFAKMLVYFMSKVFGGEMMSKFFTPSQLKVLGLDVKDIDDNDAKAKAPKTNVDSSRVATTAPVRDPFMHSTIVPRSEYEHTGHHTQTPVPAKIDAPAAKTTVAAKSDASTTSTTGTSDDFANVHISPPMDTRRPQRGNHRDAMLPSEPPKFDKETVPIEGTVIKQGKERHHFDRKTGNDTITRTDVYETDAHRHNHLKLKSTEVVDPEGERLGYKLKAGGTEFNASGVLAEDKIKSAPKTDSKQQAQVRPKSLISPA